MNASARRSLFLIENGHALAYVGRSDKSFSMNFDKTVRPQNLMKNLLLWKIQILMLTVHEQNSEVRTMLFLI